MPNHVTNKIIFAEESASHVFASCCPDGRIDFNLLVPQPPHMYKGNLSKKEDEDFPINWYTWNKENWGTKWNAYSQSCGVNDGKAFILFDTAWSVPYPALAAFANKFLIPFEHRYFDEGHNFWGIEKWDKYDGGICRVKAEKSLDEHQSLLCMELKGYGPEDMFNDETNAR